MSRGAPHSLEEDDADAWRTRIATLREIADDLSARSATAPNAPAVADEIDRRLSEFANGCTGLTEYYCHGIWKAREIVKEVAATLPGAPQPATQRSEPGRDITKREWVNDLRRHCVLVNEADEDFENDLQALCDLALKGLAVSETPPSGTAKVTGAMLKAGVSQLYRLTGVQPGPGPQITWEQIAEAMFREMLAAAPSPKGKPQP